MYIYLIKCFYLRIVLSHYFIYFWFVCILDFAYLHVWFVYLCFLFICLYRRIDEIHSTKWDYDILIIDGNTSGALFTDTKYILSSLSYFSF